MRKRILLCNEASFLNTGFSVYGMEIQKRLFQTGKFELAELASYGHPNDSKGLSLPWKYYGVLPTNPQEEQIYNSRPTNQFGEWKLDRVIADFKPHIVWDIRDHWMIAFEGISPLRRFFHWSIQPTVDSIPQHEDWIDTYNSADSVFSYTDWGLEVLRKQGGKYMNAIASHPPGAGVDIFKPVDDKRTHRAQLGIQEDVFIIGTIMRNQKRKLYPDLIESFAKFLQYCRNNNLEELANKTYLYIHTSFPDVGWHIPNLIKEHNVGSKTLVTYVCKNCHTMFPSFFSDIVVACPQCKQFAAHMPNTQTGVSREVLSGIINSFDLYVQYSIAEGCGLPQLEAAACEVPVFSVDYSGMEDVVRKVKGWPIEVQRFYKESETGCMRALPNNDDLVRKMVKFFTMPEEKRIEMGKQARQGVLDHYTWDRTAKMWENFFDNVDINLDIWNQPPQYHEPNRNIPENLSNVDFIRWGIANIWGEPNQINGPLAKHLLRNLTCGAYLEGHLRGQPFNRETFVNEMFRHNQLRNEAEMWRTNNNTPNQVTNKLEYSLA